MKRPLGQHARHLPRYRPDTDLQLQRHLAEIIEPEHDPVTHTTTAPGDTRKLRGIPAIGRGVTGHINGTSPHSLDIRTHQPAYSQRSGM